MNDEYITIDEAINKRLCFSCGEHSTSFLFLFKK